MSDPLSMLRIKTFSEPDPIGSNLSWQQNWLFKDSRPPYINAKELSTNGFYGLIHNGIPLKSQ